MDILVLHPGALGDVILSLPALDLIRNSPEKPRLVLAGNTDYLAVAAWDRACRINSISTLPLHRLFAGEEAEFHDLALWRSFHRILSWTGAADARFRARFEAVHPAVRIASWRPAPGDSRHVSQIFVDSLGPWVPPQGDIPPTHVCVRQPDFRDASEWLSGQAIDPGSPLVAFHPGAGSEAKRWPLERYAGLARLVLDRGASGLLLIEGPAEEGIALRLSEGLDPARVMAARSPSLGTLAGLLSMCRGFAGNDSGISHLAAALGIPSVVLFGPTDPVQWAPRGDRVSVLRASDSCQPCAHDTGGEHTCLHCISVEDTWAAGIALGAW